MKCPHCFRRHHSKASFEASERRRLLHDDLRASAGIVAPIKTYSITPAPSRTARHRADSEAFRSTGEMA